MTAELVRGAKGGGKGGGRSSHVPTESPDTLRSRQYARVLDLVSEGEIGGLVNGLRSVYLDDTPVQNADGTYNFSGITLSERVGTQAQSYVSGFDALEAEFAVSTEVKQSQSATRTLSNINTTAVRVTVSIPGLTFQDPKTGDLGGSSVEIAIDVQNNGGGFVAQPLRRVMDANQFSVASPGGVMQAASGHVTVDVTWTGLPPTVTTSYPYGTTYDTSPQTCTMQLQYRAAGSADAWVVAETRTFSGSPQVISSGWPYNTVTTSAPTQAGTFDLALATGRYEFRTVVTAGTGTVAVTGGAGEVPAYSDVISGKTTSRYQRSYRIKLPAGGPWDIRVRRITADSTQSNLQNKTWWDSYTEIIDAKLRYPNSAVYGLEVDAQQFNAIPPRGYEIYGIKVRVPSNYDPLLRTYSGTWDGTFTTAWSNNPAWVFHDLVTADRYGLGEFIPDAQVDKWALYSIGKYCDGMVNNGFGGLEPRFTCNLYLQTREEAFNVVADLASVFRGLVYWSAGAITAVQDAPADAVGLFTAANVIGGQFQYSGSGGRTRHTVALVTWNDPEDGYRQKVEYVPDETGIVRYGVNQTEVVAIGCTSRGQAHRFGRALLYTERMETETVSFPTGLDGAAIYPGAIIKTQDAARAGKRFGGRVIAATVNAVTLDAEINLVLGTTYELSCVLPSGAVETRAVVSPTGTTTVMSLASALTAAPQVNSIWVLTASDLVPETWRVVSVAEVDKVQMDVTALAYRTDKYAAIEQGLTLEPLPVSSISTAPPDAPSGLNVRESLYLAGLGLVGVKAVAGWDAVLEAAYYLLEYRATDGNPVQVSTSSTSVDIQPIAEGIYTFSVRAVNALGIRSQASSLGATIYGKTLPPAAVSNLQLAAISGAAHITFAQSIDLDVLVGGKLHVRHSPLTSGAGWKVAVDIGPAIPGNASGAVLPLLKGTYIAKWVDSSGNESTNAVSVITTAPDLLSMNVVETLTEHPAWSGSKSAVIYDASLGGLKLDSALAIDAMTDLIDSWGYIDAIGGIASSGEYVSATTVDLGAVMTSRLTATLMAEAFDANDLIDARGMVDTWTDVDGATVSDAFAQVYVRTTNDNPAGAPTWSAWQPFFVGDWTARAFQFKAVLASQSATHNVLVKEMRVTVDMPDRYETGNNIVSGAGTKAVTYSVPFKAVKARGITAENLQTGDYFEITSETTAGFNITFKNPAGTLVSRTFDFTTAGYGNG